ncbi:MAG: hypothetical protein M0C28_48650 [Candidatus Moduliflexus flocculans]|nr:hypothetical protein [Candidatus Moduliflexus flocculans]
MEYGYPWSRQGEVFLSDGTFVNIRAFPKPYADYTGGFLDNPYEIRVTQKPFPRPEAPPKPPQEPDQALYMKETVKAFEAIAEGGARGHPVFHGPAGYQRQARAHPGQGQGKDRGSGALPGYHGQHAGRHRRGEGEPSGHDPGPDRGIHLLPSGLGALQGLLRGLPYKALRFHHGLRGLHRQCQRGPGGGGARHTGGSVRGSPRGGRLLPLVRPGSHDRTDRGRAPHPLPRGRIDRAGAQSAALDRDIEVSVIILPH